MKKLIRSLQWLDDNILKILVIGFIFIIPLYPKLPIRMVDYTYIAIRAEDLYMVLISLVYFIQVLRRKVIIPKKYAILFGLFWLSVFTSAAVGYYYHKTVIIQNLGILHSLRRVEYMIIFFIVYTTIKTRKDFYVYLKVLFAAITLVCIYGMGQKFLGWPAVQTMNPEYAKGYILVLDAYARISSTFAGHYDLAAYIIFLMPIVLGYFLKSRNPIYFVLFVLMLGTLILTTSRASYLSFLGAITLYLVYVRKFRVLFVVLLATAILTPLSSTLTQRLTRTFQQTKIFVDPVTGEVMVPKEMRVDELPRGDFGSNVKVPTTPNKKPVVVDKKTENLAKKQIREDIVKEANKTGQILTEDQIMAMVNNTFARQIPIEKYLLDISLSTRFQVEWPRAIDAFKTNPLLGTGPSSITEATDGDYLRWLGETGALGTLLFLGIIGSIVKSVWVHARHISKQESYLFYGFVFGTIGLMVNAMYIDVFEASKMAYTYWLVAGMFMAAVTVFIKEKATTKSLKMN